MSWHDLPWFHSVWDCLGFLDFGGYFLPHFKEVFNYYLKYFHLPFPLSSYGIPMIWILGHLTLSQRSLRLSSFLLILFSCSASFISTILSFSSLILSSASVIQLLVPSSVSSTVIALFFTDRLFFIYSRPLLNTSCIFSIFISI